MTIDRLREPIERAVEHLAVTEVFGSRFDSRTVKELGPC